MTKKIIRLISTIVLITLILGCVMVVVMGCTEEVNGRFYRLQEAYDEGLLTQEDLLNIAYYHNGGIKGNEDLFPENYVPKQKDNLDNSVTRKVKQGYLNQFYSKDENTSIDDVTILQYYGTYNGCVAVMISDEYSGVSTAIVELTVANVWIKFMDGREIIIWKETV
ncbi:MAG: hypothetical protein K2M64_01280 [Clostridia bacterium]|nr:hypothetical protein [Clostridia bacterium]